MSIAYFYKILSTCSVFFNPSQLQNYPLKTDSTISGMLLGQLLILSNPYFLIYKTGCASYMQHVKDKFHSQGPKTRWLHVQRGKVST